MKYTLLLLSLCLHLTLSAQQEACDGQRFLVETFPEVTVTSGIQYGAGYTIGGNPKNLLLDIYEPTGDTATQRPAMVLAFGGSFIFGTRQDIAPLCHYYAQRGYVVASIDYRLFDLRLFPLPTEAEMEIVVVKAISDMKAAVRYLREDAATADRFRIDPEMIIVGGISAGGITAAHVVAIDSLDHLSPNMLAAIHDNGGFEGNTSDNYAYTSAPQALLNFSGALRDARWLDADSPPVFSAHDDMDGVVPYGQGQAIIFGMPITYLEGSERIHEVADSLSIYNQLHTIPNSTEHVSYFNDMMTSAEIIDESLAFLYPLVCEGIDPTDVTEQQLPTVHLYPNPARDIVYLDYPATARLTFRLYNTTGQLVRQATGSVSLPLNGLPAGIYTVQVADHNQSTFYHYKLIVQP